MRIPKQVLVVPYLVNDKKLELCILKRSDLDIWQWVAGGVESNESVIEAAIRESNEELGVCLNSEDVLKLETECSIPKYHFKLNNKDSNDFYTVKEFAFAINITKAGSISLSREHTKFKIITYEELSTIETWDSNITAAWELRQRLLDQNIITG